MKYLLIIFIISGCSKVIEPPKDDYEIFWEHWCDGCGGSAVNINTGSIPDGWLFGEAISTGTTNSKQ